MIEPQKNWQILVRRAEADRIGEMNGQAFAVIAGINGYIRRWLTVYFNASPTQQRRLLKGLDAHTINEYQKLLRTYKQDIINSLNESSIEQRFLVANTLGREPNIKPFPFYDKLPLTDDFKITRRILSERSITLRSRKLSNRISKLIKKANGEGKSITATTKLIEIELGLRDRRGGKLTKRAKELLRSGKFARSNGHFYDFYRIARTETMRMASIQSNNQFKELVKSGEDARLKMVSVIDSRTRPQSVEMNGQISRKDGKFKYPNGFYYQHGEAPVRWTANDRESSITIFLDDEPQGDKVYKSIAGYKRAIQLTLDV